MNGNDLIGIRQQPIIGKSDHMDQSLHHQPIYQKDRQMNRPLVDEKSTMTNENF